MYLGFLNIKVSDINCERGEKNTPDTHEKKGERERVIQEKGGKSGRD